MNEIKPFLDSEGRIRQFPSKRRKKLMVLLYIGEQLPEGVMTEREVNEFLNSRTTLGDPVTLRRDLVDHGCLLRDRAGREYRRADPQPTLEELEALYPS